MLFFLNIPGYFIDNDLRLDGEDTIRGIGGGLLVYVCDGLVVKPLPNQCNFKQYIGLEVIGKNCSKNVYPMYRLQTPHLTITQSSVSFLTSLKVTA